MSTTSTSRTSTPGSAQGPLRPRGGRRLLAPLAGMAVAAALVAGCGAQEPTDPEDTVAEETQDEAPDDPEDSDAPDDPDDQENLFEGSWHFGHHEQVLSAEELAAVVEQEALDRGPEEMHLTVECADGIDAGADDTEAECVAIADEGVEHPWMITALPADTGLEVEVENVD